MFGLLIFFLWVALTTNVTRWTLNDAGEIEANESSFEYNVDDPLDNFARTVRASYVSFIPIFNNKLEENWIEYNPNALLYSDTSPLYDDVVTSVDHLQSIQHRHMLPPHAEVLVNLLLYKQSGHSVEQQRHKKEQELVDAFQVGDKSRASTWIALANTWRATGDTFKTIQSIRQALWLNESESEALFTLSEVVRHLECSTCEQDAFYLIEKAIQQKKTPIYYLSYAGLCKDFGRLDDAIEACSQAVALEGSFGPCEALQKDAALLLQAGAAGINTKDKHRNQEGMHHIPITTFPLDFTTATHAILRQDLADTLLIQNANGGKGGQKLAGIEFEASTDIHTMLNADIKQHLKETHGIDLSMHEGNSHCNGKGNCNAHNPSKPTRIPAIVADAECHVSPGGQASCKTASGTTVVGSTFSVSIGENGQIPTTHPSGALGHTTKDHGNKRGSGQHHSADPTRHNGYRGQHASNTPKHRRSSSQQFKQGAHGSGTHQQEDGLIAWPWLFVLLVGTSVALWTCGGPLFSHVVKRRNNGTNGRSGDSPVTSPNSGGHARPHRGRRNIPNMHK